MIHRRAYGLVLDPSEVGVVNSSEMGMVNSNEVVIFSSYA